MGSDNFLEGRYLKEVAQDRRDRIIELERQSEKWKDAYLTAIARQNELLAERDAAVEEIKSLHNKSLVKVMLDNIAARLEEASDG